MKKVISLFLSIVMLVGVVASVDLSAYAQTYSGPCGDNVVWSLDTDTGTLTISGNGNMADGYSSLWYNQKNEVKTVDIEYGVTSIGYCAFSCCSSLTSITIPDSVTSIGNNAFSSCSNLTSITIPDSVTSIGDSTFSSCGSLISITIPDSVTYIGAAAFAGCGKLTSVTIPDSVTSIGDGAFEFCESLTSVTIPDSVTSIGDGAFEYCKSLTSVTIPDNVTSIGDYAFHYCKSLTSVTISNSVTNIGECAFAYCESLTSINVDEDNNVYDSRNNCNAIIKSSANTLISGCKNTIIPNSVTSIGKYAFNGCSSLRSITIPSNVTSIDEGAFVWCLDLTNIAIPNSVTSIGGGAFGYCISLTSVTIPSSVTSIGYAPFFYCANITNINVDLNNKNYSSQNGVLFNKNKTELIQYPIGNERESYIIPNSVTSVSGAAFAYCKLTSVTITNSVTSIGEWAFGECRRLAYVYYTGTKNEWNRISIGSDNECLTNATIHYNYNTNNNFTIKLYSAMPALTIGAGQEINCAVQLENNGIPVNGNDKASFEISISNSDILNVSNIRKDKQAEQTGENCTLFTLNGKKEGHTKLRIKEINTGLVYETTINVSNGILSFAANCMPSYYDHQFEYNGYVSGMYIDEFQYNEKQSTLSFDV